MGSGDVPFLISLPGDADAGGPKFDLDPGMVGHHLCDVHTLPT